MSSLAFLSSTVSMELFDVVWVVLRAVSFIAACEVLYLAPYPVQWDMSTSKLATFLAWPVSDVDGMGKKI